MDMSDHALYQNSCYNGASYNNALLYAINELEIVCTYHDMKFVSYIPLFNFLTVFVRLLQCHNACRETKPLFIATVWTQLTMTIGGAIWADYSKIYLGEKIGQGR